ncbi:dienelactone hydrolase family protein [Sneathiella chinensis]|uniref:Dienelactone hydrolase domain-containing protein n=1 Tax=Sneathiella chinensis TaxID=349750 RepID=A0ABQ5U0H3_9PROT|nr:dienelactone hydrolase family protein [Sneathiella chinensis]GLQ05617.1 hypothetical protein GCM10007924_08380 [Sneathiella chinensis]
MYARRDVVKSVGMLPLAVILADPVLARAAASTLEDVSLILENGDRVRASVAMPEVTPAPAVILIHEWWGLNDYIKSTAAEFAKAGYIAVAIDLYKGQVASTPEEARAYMGAVEAPIAGETLARWIRWAGEHEKGTGRVGTVGWCFGGGWSLNASINSPVDATVIYYGNVAKKAEALRAMEGPVQGHFATEDKWINMEMVGGFVEEMKKAGQPDPEIYWYEADHAFANPSGGRYDQADAQLAWSRTVAFLKAHL